MIHDSIRAAREIAQHVSLEIEKAANTPVDAVDENGQQVHVEPKSTLQGLMSFIQGKLGGNKVKRGPASGDDIIGSIDTSKPVVAAPAVVAEAVVTPEVVVTPTVIITPEKIEPVEPPQPIMPIVPPQQQETPVVEPPRVDEPLKPEPQPPAYVVGKTAWIKPKKVTQPAGLERQYKVKITGRSGG